MNTSLESRTSSSHGVIGLREVISVIKRGAPIAVLVAIVATATAVFLTSRQPPVYTSVATLVAVRPAEHFGNLVLVTPPQVDPRVFQSAVLEGTILRDAITEVTGNSPSETDLREFRKALRVSVEAQLVSGIVRIEVRNSSAALAAEYANRISENLIEWDRSRATQFVAGSIDALMQAIAEIDSQIAQLGQGDVAEEIQRRQLQLATQRDQLGRELEGALARRATAVPVSSIELLQPASVPDEPSGPRLVFNTFVAGALGLIFGYIFQIIRWVTATNVGNRHRLEQLSEVPILGVFTDWPKKQGPRETEAASYFRANVMRTLNPAKSNVIGVTGVNKFSNSKGVAGTLAERFATSGFKTLLIEGDLRQTGPGSITSSRSTNAPSLKAYLQNADLPVQPVVVRIDDITAFDLLPSYSASSRSSELLTRGLRPLLDGLRSTYCIIIVDLPPVLHQADAASSVFHTDGVILCTGVETELTAVTTAISSLESAGGNVLGTVLTGAKPRQNK